MIGKSCSSHAEGWSPSLSAPPRRERPDPARRSLGPRDPDHVVPPIPVLPSALPSRSPFPPFPFSLALLPGVRTGRDRIREYFVGFLADKVIPSFPAEIAEDDIQQLGDGVAAYSGYYTFYLSKGHTADVANAKFTYIYKKGADGKLKIILHNSGFTPDNPLGCPPAST